LFAPVIKSSGVPLAVFPRKFRLDPSPIASLWKEVGRLKPDVVHSWGWMASFASEICCKRWRIPHVSGVIRRGMVPPRKSLHLKVASSLGNLVIANSQAGLDAFGIPSARGRVIYNGFDPERFEIADFDRMEPVPGTDGRFHVVMAATMDDRKDFSLFIRSAENLVAGKNSTAKFTALGGGVDFDTLVSSASDMIKAGHFFFPGRVPEVMEYYNTAHVGVLLSTYGEGLSNSIMEYMASSLPVVCTDQGGNRELVVDGVTGFLIPPSDSEALVEKLVWLETNRGKALAMGRAGRKRIEREFSVAKMIDRSTEIYSEVIVQR